MSELFSTGWLTCGVASNTGTGTAWVASGATLVADLGTSDDSRAVAANVLSGGRTKYLKTRDYGASLPSRALVSGIMALIERHASGVSMSDYSVKLYVAGIMSGDEKGSASVWGLADADKLYGSPNDDWNISPTPDIVNSANFGIHASAKYTGTTTSDAKIDYLALNIWYELPQIVVIDRHTWTLPSGRTGLRLAIQIRTDGGGNMYQQLAGELALPETAILDHLVVVADPTEAPSANWDLYLREPAGVDVLNGDGENLAAAVDSAIWPHDTTAGAATHEPIRTRQPWELQIQNAGADTAMLVVLYLITD